MLTRYRHRRGPYALAEPSPAGGLVRKLIAWIIIAAILYLLVKWALAFMGVGNHIDRKSVQLDVENRSNVTVSLEGGLMQHADKRVKLLPEDKIVSNGGGHALLTFFDGTIARMDEQSEVTIDESSLGSKSSEIALTLNGGALWVRTADASTFSGTIVRTIATDTYVATLPSDAEVVLGAHTVMVFSADGDGVMIGASGADDVYVGEGQQLLVPENETFTGDLRRYRSAMDPLAVRRAFIEESRSITPGSAAPGAGPNVTPPADVNLITVEMPLDGQTVSGSTVRVQGTVGARIERVRVNGYPASIDRSQGTYSQELAMPGTETFTIRVEALDRTGVVVEQQERTVKPAKAATALAPTITKPGRNGEIVRTAAEEVEIRGTAPTGTVAMYVNDYKLQLFRAGDADWSYLASKRFDNLKDGDNVFNVVAEDSSGARSPAATITIAVGVNGPTTPAGATSSAPAQVSESTLPNNAPLKPGTLAVTAPSGGTGTTYSGTGFLLEGTTARETASVWVNGYQLKLYTPGKTFWNYWATAAYGTLKKGTNVYRIVARDKDNQILDVFTYTVEYQ